VDGVDADLVEHAHRDGRSVNAWTVTDWRDAAACLDAGVDGVISDYPGVTDYVERGATLG
jgi:glycerophosphoryl diester phosphodiesterase